MSGHELEALLHASLARLANEPASVEEWEAIRRALARATRLASGCRNAERRRANERLSIRVPVTEPVTTSPFEPPADGKYRSTGRPRRPLPEDRASSSTVVEFDTREYVLSHGHEPKGRGSWAFCPLGDESSTRFFPVSTLAEAKRAARVFFNGKADVLVVCS